jgi:aspartyl protease family protein
MSTFTHPIEIGDPAGDTFELLEARVDTGATFTVVPADTLRRLGVKPLESLPFELADERVIEREVGETKVRIAGKTISTPVVFGGEEGEALIGAHTLERAFLAVDPARHRLVPTRGLLKLVA